MFCAFTYRKDLRHSLDPKLPSRLLDGYAYRARLLPALLTILPVAATIAVADPATHRDVWSSVASLSSAFGVMALFSAAVRARGRAVERRLMTRWGVLHSVSMLRHADTTLDSHTKTRYHAQLASHLPSLRVPSAVGEQADSRAADTVYESAVRWLREQTRDAGRFPLIREENVAYGFRRNLYGAKPLGLGLSVLCLAWVGWLIYTQAPTRIADVSLPHLVLLALLVAIILCWCVVVTEAFVVDASKAYARALLAACDTLPPPARAGQPGGLIAP